MDRDEAEGERTKSFPSLDESRYSQSLERGLAILACFTPEQPVLGIAEIADQLEMARATTHRYVSTLVALGYLRQDASRKYRLGLGAAELGMAALNAMSLPAHAHPYMARLSRRTGQTVELAVLDGAETLLVHRISRRRHSTSEHGGGEVGSRRPAHRTSAGLVLLAQLPSAQCSRLIARLELAARPPGMPSEGEALEAELARVRREGVAIIDNDLTDGICAIGAAVRGESGHVAAAVSVVAECEEIHAQALAERVRDQLHAAAELISARLGWQAPE